jgi:tRNA(Arg) A34 adenosine deaminase TadA
MSDATIDARDLRIMNTLRVIVEDVPPVTGTRMAAAVAIRGTVLSMGNNQLRTHPFAARFGKNPDALFWHAETKAIHNFIRKHHPDDLQKATLYVMRIKRPLTNNKKWVMGMARPCKGCYACVQDFGIPRVVFSNADGGFSCESV